MFLKKLKRKRIKKLQRIIQLGVSYDDLEWAMNCNSENLDEKSANILRVYNKHREQNLHKMQKIPVFKKDA